MMTYSIEYIENEDYILVTHEGIVDGQYINRVTKEIAQNIFDHQCHKVLSDYRKTNFKLNPSEIIAAQQKVVDSLSEKGLSPYQMKRALVVNNDRENVEAMTFFETVSINRWQNVKFFVDIDNAIDWLIQE